MTYTAVPRRTRQNRTNYRKRIAILVGRHSFVSITVSNQNIMAQVLKPQVMGDIVITAVSSKELLKYGWKGSMNSMPSCYLTGLLLGIRTLEKGMKNLVLYTGKKSFTTRVASCLKGIIDAGVSIPVSEVSLPEIERLNGGHISRYAEVLKKDEQKYNSHFSSLLENGFLPENYPRYFEEVKTRIIKNIRTEPNSSSSERSKATTKKATVN
ncbi:MAG: 50S ribosomal protein L18 [Candidatus Nitrosopolaris sp.]|jgi:large subunit ribosomal protein L18